MGKACGTPFAVPDACGAYVPYPSFDEAEAQALCRTVAGFDYLWRVEAVTYATGDEYGGWRSTPPRLELFYCSVKKWTPTGARLWEGRHVDLRPDRKQWASRTPAEALAQFISRRKAQIRILERQLSRAKEELRLAESPAPTGVPELIQAMKGPHENA